MKKTMMMIELATGWLYTAGVEVVRHPNQTKKGHGVGTPHHTPQLWQPKIAQCG